jgi:cystathionine beta-lyase
MRCQFDAYIDRSATESEKWRHYGPDVLPLWVADMDFTAPEPVVQALRRRVDHGIYGYGGEPPELRPLLVERLKRLYQWEVAPEALVFSPGVIVGFNQACQALAQPAEGLLIQTPVYGPIIRAAANGGFASQQMALTRQPDGRYIVDLDLMERTIQPGCTRAFLMCNPHNPVGRVFTRPELEGMAELCLRHDLYIVSDEIHCDLLMAGHQHIPIASLSPEVAARTVTLMAPSKTFNIAGLKCSFAVIPDKSVRERFTKAARGLVSSINILGYLAALTAYRDGQPWLDELLPYLTENRNLVYEFVARHLPGMGISVPEGTYLAWLDCRKAELPGNNPHAFFLEKAHVGLNDGFDFGEAGRGFLRLNFGCCRSTLEEALQRMAEAWRKR